MRKTKGRKRASTKECFDTDGSTKLKVLFIMVVSAAVFFYFAFSSYDNTLKAIILLGDLVLTGTIVRQLTGWEGYYGLLIVRGKRGFGLMAWFAKRFEPALRELMDFGMSLGFGILYSHLLFKDKPKKFIIHSLLVVAFFAWTYFQFIQVIGGAMGSLVFLLSLLLGLFALGYSFLIISSFNILSYYYSKFILNVVPAGPAPAAGAMPVIPGITIPFWEGIIAIIIVASVHELAHGVMCNIVKLRIKSSGALLFGFLPIGAFVEPDEEKFKNIPIHAKRSILIAGSTSNFVFFLLFLLISLGVGLIIPQMVERVEIINVSPNSSALGILHVNESILKIDGTPIKNVGDVSSVMSGKGVGEKVVLTTESGDKEIVLKEKGKIGITLAEIPKENASLFFAALKFLLSALTLTWFLSFALSVFNLLPLFITDGQRIVYDELSYRLGKRRKRLAMKISIALGIITILLLIANLLPWFGI